MKKNKISRVHVKDTSCNSLQDFRPLLKRDSNMGIFLQAGQLPQEHLSFLQNLLNFIIKKYFKKEVTEDLNVCNVAPVASL